MSKSLSSHGRYLTRLLYRGLVLAILLTGYTPQAEAARLPSAKRECAICHIMWLTDFKRTDIKTLIPYDPTPVEDVGKTDIVSTSRMCFSCHDGFVLDSRYMWKQGTHAHSVGMKPSEKVKIPLVEGKELFPLNNDGNVYCGTCHSAHGVDWEQSKTAVFMRMENKGDQLCVACHEEKKVGPEKGGHAVIENKLDEIPAALIKSGARFDDGGKVLCQSCHRAHGAADKKMLVLQNDRSQLCGACHTKQYPPDRNAAGRMGTHPVNVRPDQAKIPETLKKQGAKSGTQGEIICQSCHRPHDATPKTPILVQANDNSALCETCHQDQKSIAGSQHDMKLVDTNSKNVRKESVGEGGVCSACHLAHEGTGPKMWARPLAENIDPMAALCLSCHSKEGLAKKSLVGSYSHPTGVANVRTGQIIELPTFNHEGVKQADAGKGFVTCASCHNPHRWDPADPEAKSRPGTKGNSTNRFLRKVNSNDSKLCKTCHQKQANVNETKHNLKLTAPGERNIRDQGQEQSGICGTCHLVHNAAGPYLWARKMTSGTNIAEAICTDCHNSNGLAKKKLVGEHSHPTGVDLKALPILVENGRWTSKIAGTAGVEKPLPLPLYDKQGRHTLKSGQVKCGTCHDPHAWSPDKRSAPMKDIAKTEGGPDDSFLRIADKGESALCVNCHQDKQAVSNSRHNLALIGIKDTHNENRAHNDAAGICTTCHLPHNAKGSILWARETGPGKGAIEVLCTDCHQKGGNAEKKLPGSYNHPLDVKLTAAMKPHGLPVYAKDGKRTANNGVIDCATCHDPHRWTADAGISVDLKEEGDARNSFLRLTAAPASQLCVECHQDKLSVLGTDHDLTVTAPAAVNRHGLTANKSGVCGQCHIPHGGLDGLLLWARFLDDDATNPAEKRCRSCHRQGENASHKSPAASKHPDNVRALSNTLRTAIYGRPMQNLPVYDKAGKQAAVGVITCPSCHNPHQWDPARDARGAGKNVEGDVRTSFLRIQNSKSFTCADCHGADSLFRYKYFHSKSTHRE